MDGQLQIVGGPNQGGAIPFAEGQVIRIGRGAGADAQLTDPYVSRSHCQIEIKGGRMTLTDLGSSRGTVVNGLKIEGQHVVKPGDVITIGATKLTEDFTFALTDPTVSRLHCTVRLDRDTVQIVDEGSTNGEGNGRCADRRRVALRQTPS